MRHLLLIAGLFVGCGGGAEEDPRARYEREFPEAYCAWINRLSLEYPEEDYMMPEDCVRYYAAKMAAEREYHVCFSPSRAEACLAKLAQTDEDCTTEIWGPNEECIHLDAGFGFYTVRPRPGDCALVTWDEPCEYGTPPEPF